MYTPHLARSVLRSLPFLLLLVSAIACDRVTGAPSPSPLAATPTQTRPGSPAPPTATTAASGPGVGNDNIKVARPSGGQEVRSPMAIQGQARVFEGNVQFALKDGRGQTLASGFTTASKGAPDWGDYKADLAFRVTARQDATLEVFTESARDGSPQFVVKLPVTLLPN